MEAPRGVEPTGTNGRTRHTFSDSLVWGSGLVLWWFLSLDGKECCFLWSRNDTGEAFLFASVVRFPDRHDRNRGWFRCRPPVLPVGRCIGFAVVMAQVRRPVPFRTRKLRPGRGDGTALERVWESSTPPHSFVGVPVERDAPGTPFFCLLVRVSRGAREAPNPQHST